MTAHRYANICLNRAGRGRLSRLYGTGCCQPMPRDRQLSGRGQDSMAALHVQARDHNELHNGDAWKHD